MLFSDICTFFNDLHSFQLSVLFQISALLSNICTSFRFLHFFQISALLSDFCTSFRYMHFFQISALLSNICILFNYLCFFRYLHFFAIIRVYPRKKTAGSQNYPAAVKLFFNFPLFMPLSSSNHLTRSDICSRTSRKYPPYDGMS